MAKRELIDTGRSKRYIRRDERGRFTSDQSQAGASLSRDRRRHAIHEAAPGQGDRGDRRRTAG
jgi:hypothetical protein